MSRKLIIKDVCTQISLAAALNKMRCADGAIIGLMLVCNGQKFFLMKDTKYNYIPVNAHSLQALDYFETIQEAQDYIRERVNNNGYYIYLFDTTTELYAWIADKTAE